MEKSEKVKEFKEVLDSFKTVISSEYLSQDMSDVDDIQDLIDTLFEKLQATINQLKPLVTKNIIQRPQNVLSN